MAHGTRPIPFLPSTLVDDGAHRSAMATPSRRTEDDAWIGANAAEFVGAVSHEMRNPLNGLLGMTHLLRETRLDAAQQNYLDGITQCGDVLLGLVNDLLDMTALNQSVIDLDLAPTDMEALINGCIEVAAPSAHEKGLAIGSFIDPSLCGAGKNLIRIDERRVRQIITNLVSNAIKFTDHGGVRLAANVDVSSPAPVLMIDVVDTGRGIPADDQDLVFQPFGRSTSQSEKPVGGTGLGLPLSLGLAKAMGGSLKLLSSAVDSGTHMRFVLPLKDARFSDPFVVRTLAGHRVLLMLHPALANSPEADALRQTLKASGADVHVSKSVAPDSPDLNAFDDVLIDAGFDHALLWARLSLSASGIRPILLLRPDDRDLLPHYEAAGFSGYLIRPVRQSSLVAMLTHRFDASDHDIFRRDPVDAPPPCAGDKVLRLLIAEDEPVNARLAAATLQRAGHHTHVVADGDTVLQVYEEAGADAWDVILLDLSMPGLNGFDTAAALRRAGYKGRILAYSGNTDPNLSAKVRQAGFDAFAQKPLLPDALLDFVAKNG